MKTLYFYNKDTKRYTHTRDVLVGVSHEFSTDVPPDTALKDPAFIMGGWTEFTPNAVKHYKHSISRYQFMKLFKTTELVGIYAAAKTDPVVEVWVRTLESAQEVTIIDPDIKAGLDYLVTANLLVAARADEIRNQ